MVSKSQMRAGGTITLVLCNVLVLAAAFHAADAVVQKSVDDESLMNPALPYDLDPPSETELPNQTVTKEMKVRMFFDELRVDHSLIDPDLILQCISPWEPYIEKYSAAYDIDPDLVRAIIFAESKGDPYTISRNGAVGLMQIMPVTSEFMGIDDPLDPEQNIKAGTGYIAWLIKYFGESHVLWAWNAGPTKMSQHTMPRETKQFILTVMSVRSYLKTSDMTI